MTVRQRFRRVRDYYRYYRIGMAGYPNRRGYSLFHALKAWNPRSYG